MLCFKMCWIGDVKLGLLKKRNFVNQPGNNTSNTSSVGLTSSFLSFYEGNLQRKLVMIWKH